MTAGLRFMLWISKLEVFYASDHSRVNRRYCFFYICPFCLSALRRMICAFFLLCPRGVSDVMQRLNSIQSFHIMNLSAAFRLSFQWNDNNYRSKCNRSRNSSYSQPLNVFIFVGQYYSFVLYVIGYTKII